MIQMSLLTKHKRLTDFEKEFMVVEGKIGRRPSQAVWDGHENLLNCFVAGCLGGEFWGKSIHVYVWLSHFAVHLKLSQYCLLIGCTSIQNKKLKKILMESSLSIISFLDSSFGVVLKQSSPQTRSSQVFFYFIFWVFYTFKFYIYVCDSF